MSRRKLDFSLFLSKFCFIPLLQLFSVLTGVATVPRESRVMLRCYSSITMMAVDGLGLIMAIEQVSQNWLVAALGAGV
jgi:hypothetical protein